MRRRRVWVSVAAIAVCVLSGCGGSSSRDEGSPEPAKVEVIPGSDAKQVVLTAKAAARLDIQTAPLADADVGGTMRATVPYAAVLYAADGSTWVYTRTAELTFAKKPISVERIEGDRAILLSGPPAGTPVVTVGAAELLGAESGVGEG